MRQRYSVIGLGKLGACSAACIASKGFSVVGVDISEQAVAAVNEGRAPVKEPGLDELMVKAHPTLRATTSFVDAIHSSDVTLIIVPTPSKAHGGFDLRYVASACRQIGAALAAKDTYHLVDIVSTVLPGSCEYHIMPLLEQASGKQCGEHFGLCYNPEFIALGSVIHDFLNPDFVLVGQSDEQAGQTLEGCYGAFCDNDPPVRRMNLISAELAKISLNTYVTTKITYANMLAKLCEHLPGADVDAITTAIGLDQRVGGRFLKAGLGYGGPCFPRDNVALSYMARSLETRAQVAETTDSGNDEVLERLQALVTRGLQQGGVVGVMGVTYKPRSLLLEESQGWLLARNLAREGVEVVIYDPLIDEQEIAIQVPEGKPERLQVAGSSQELLGRCSTVVVANPDPEFSQLTAEDFHGLRTPRRVIDCWRSYRELLADDPQVRYVAWGVGQADEERVARLRRMVEQLT
jgi:UDPglucose 6-dehydrogenase